MPAGCLTLFIINKAGGLIYTRYDPSCLLASPLGRIRRGHAAVCRSPCTHAGTHSVHYEQALFAGACAAPGQ